MDPQTRTVLRQRAITIWLRADLPVLIERVGRRTNRPLLKQDDPEAVLRRLMDVRYPVYAEADITVDSLDAPAERTTEAVFEALADYLRTHARAGAAS
jgi:shikimate kinase